MAEVQQEVKYKFPKSLASSLSPPTPIPYHTAISLQKLYSNLHSLCRLNSFGPGELSYGQRDGEGAAEKEQVEGLQSINQYHDNTDGPEKPTCK